MAEGHGWGGASRTGSNHPASLPPGKGFSRPRPLKFSQACAFAAS
jgi:hypothetical protein